MAERLQKILTGIAFRQEYLCLALESLEDTLSVHLTSRESARGEDVTARHAFVGYKPAVIALPATPGSRSLPGPLCLNFSAGDFAANSRWKSFPGSRDSVAQLIVDRFHECTIDDLSVGFYRGVAGRHRFISAFHRLANRAAEAVRKKRPGNIDLPGNAYEQVRILYSIPRIISLISVGSADSMNLFPTDLHGPLGERHYVSSLRIGGQACQQVQEARRLVLSDIDATAFRQAYTLGRNHMKKMAAAAAFELHERRSAHFGIPLPAAVIRYRELEWQQYFDVGVHRVFVYRVAHAEAVKQAPRLAHVHKYYAQWRSRAHPDTGYLLR